MGGVVMGTRKPTRPDSIHVVRGQETRRAILAAARGRIIADGFEALRLDDLASDVGITKPAVIKSVGGKATILLTLRNEDRLERIRIITEGAKVRGNLRSRLTHMMRLALEMEQPRIELVNAYIGYSWFWKGKDHQSVEEGFAEVRNALMEMIAATEPGMAPAHVQALAWRICAAYLYALRKMHNEKMAVEPAVEFAIGIALD